MDRGAGPDPRLATTLRTLREATGRSQEDIAHSAGLTIASYGRIERGQSDPSWSSVVRIAGALGITLERVGREVERRR